MGKKDKGIIIFIFITEFKNVAKKPDLSMMALILAGAQPEEDYFFSLMSYPDSLF